jgi:hypothetical protein
VGYPIRPGVNRLRVVFHLSQSGAAWITVQQPVGIKNVVVMVPVSLRLESKVPGALKAQGIEDGQAKYWMPETRTARPLVFRVATNFAEQLESRTSRDETPLKRTAPIAADLSRYIASSSTWPAEHNSTETAGPGRRRLLLGAILMLVSMGTFAAVTISSRRASRRSAA